jgi:hypothetical protein
MTSPLSHNGGLAALFFAACASLYTITGQAQDENRALVLCEGGFYFDTGEVIEWPTLGVYTEADGTYEVLKTYYGHHFAADLLVDGSDLYVAVEDTVYHYDVNTYGLIASQPVDGARKLAIWNDALLVSRGDFNPVTWAPVSFDSYLQWFDREDLSWMGESPTSSGPSFSGAGIVIEDNTAHMIINNGFDWGMEVGLVGHIDLITGGYTETDLGINGLNPIHLFASEDGLVTVNTMQYASTSLSRVAGGMATTELVADVSAGCGAASLWDENLVFQISGETTVRVHGANDLTASGAWGAGETEFYAMASSVAWDRVFAGSTDFVTTGGVSVFNIAGELQTSFATGLAPGHFSLVAGPNAVADAPASLLPRVEVARYDLMGRRISTAIPAAGLVVVRYADGTASVQRILD